MNIPILPHEKPIDDNGQWTASWLLWFQQLTRLLQTHLSDQGFQLPLKPTEIITHLSKESNAGTLIYDSSTQQFKGNVKGTFKVFTMG